MNALHLILAQGWAFTVYCTAWGLAAVRVAATAPRSLRRHRAYMARCRARDARRLEDTVWHAYRESESDHARELANRVIRINNVVPFEAKQPATR